MSVADVVQEIQYTITPAVMVSSAALLLLGLHTKFSNLSSRFRGLNQEKRQLAQKPGKGETETARLNSLLRQIDVLMKRASYVKNAILFTYLAIVCFLGTSILIFLNLSAPFRLGYVIAAVLLAGFLALIVTTVLMFPETVLFYRIIIIEKNN